MFKNAKTVLIKKNFLLFFSSLVNNFIYFEKYLQFKLFSKNFCVRNLLESNNFHIMILLLMCYCNLLIIYLLFFVILSDWLLNRNIFFLIQFSEETGVYSWFSSFEKKIKSHHHSFLSKQQKLINYLFSCFSSRMYFTVWNSKVVALYCK